MKYVRVAFLMILSFYVGALTHDFDLVKRYQKTGKVNTVTGDIPCMVFKPAP